MGAGGVCGECVAEASMTTKATPLTEAEERRWRAARGGLLSTSERVWATLDAIRAQLAKANTASAAHRAAWDAADARAKAAEAKLEASEEEYRQFRMSAREELAAATERAEKAEAELVMRRAESLRYERGRDTGQRERDAMRLRYEECAQCSGALEPNTTPPHCDDCVVDDEHMHAWDEALAGTERGKDS